MGGAVFTPLTRNWQWWYDDAAEPTASYQSENTEYSGSGSSSTIFRLRWNWAETGGKAANGQSLAFEYSTNQTDWVAPGASAAWNYADGQGTHGNTVTSLKLSDTSTNGEYIETTGGAFSFAASSNNEFDLAITPGSTISSGTRYYFRAVIAGTGRAPAGGETYPSIVFTIISPSPTPSLSISATPSLSISATQTPSITPTITPSLSISATQTPSITPSSEVVSPSPTPSLSISATQTPSITPTITPSLSISATQTPSITPTITPSLSISATQTPSITPTITPSLSISATRTPSITPTITPSLSISATQTPSITPTITPSLSVSSSSGGASPSPTPSLSISATQTPSITPTITPSLSISVTPSLSISATRTASITPSSTPSLSISSTPSLSISITPSLSISATRTPSLTPSPSEGAIYSNYVVKYTTTDIPNTIRLGNIAFGVHGVQEWGETAITDFWNGMDAPTNGYVIYKLTASRTEPSIVVAHNDNEVIYFARSYGGTNINTVGEAINYLLTGSTDVTITDTDINTNLFTNSYDWTDSNADGLADNWTCPNEGTYPQTKSIVTGNGFSGNAQRIQENNGINYAMISHSYNFVVDATYWIRGKYRSSHSLSLHKATGSEYTPGTGNLGPANTGNAAPFNFKFVAEETSWYIASVGVDAWLEIDEVELVKLYLI